MNDIITIKSKAKEIEKFNLDLESEVRNLIITDNTSLGAGVKIYEKSSLVSR
jgi:hypothetical protein